MQRDCNHFLLCTTSESRGEPATFPRLSSSVPGGFDGDLARRVGGFQSPFSSGSFSKSASECQRPVRWGLRPVRRVPDACNCPALSECQRLLRQTDVPLLLRPGVWQCPREVCHRELAFAGDAGLTAIGSHIWSLVMQWARSHMLVLCVPRARYLACQGARRRSRSPSRRCLGKLLGELRVRLTDRRHSPN
jgi:hypothetical protein